MSNLISKSLHLLGSKHPDAFVIQIGANDGISFDDTRGFLDLYKWPALLVEPIPEIFKELQNNFIDRSNYIYEQSAITEVDGLIKMLNVSNEVINKNELHPGYKGMSALYPLKNGFGTDYERDIYVKNNLAQNIEVNGITFSSLLSKHNISKFDVLICDAEGHDWAIFKQIDLTKYRPKVIRLEYTNLNEQEQHLLIQKLETHNYEYEISGQDIDAVDSFWVKDLNLSETLTTPAKEAPLNSTGEKLSTCKSKNNNQNLTIVSGLWDINRVGRDWSRYEEHFDKFLKIPCNMVLWIPKSLEAFVWERRSKENTFVRLYELDDIKNGMFSPFWDKWQSIRNNPSWQNQAGWLPESPQCKNEYYNPIVMSKMFFLHDSKIWNPFDTDYFIWLDAGISQTVYENYFYESKNLDRITQNLDPFLFLSYPYEADKEIHGFEFNAINRYAQSKVEYVCRGGLFGGHKDFLSQANSEYYHLLQQSITEGLAGTEESVFAILAKLHPENYRRYELDGNGLIVKFMQEIDSDTVKLVEVEKPKNKFTPTINDISNIKTNLYFLTFNFPDQLEATIKSLQKHEGFLTHPHQKIIIDNSTDPNAREGNKLIAQNYGFEHISMDKNTGICGGRQFAAEHFDASESDFYLFFEDDMTISDPEEGICRNGFNKYVPDLYKKLHQIMLKEKFDFLKLSYTEVYMDNNIQVSWYNVPQAVRTEVWPDYDKLPTTGLDPNCPRTQFKNIEVLNGLSYISGEVYYANWPHITSREGNKKMFINTKWAHPYEQTWMSHIFQETRKGNIKPGIILASAVTHDRFKHYKPEERIEG
jgi:FkbM family methyltransferase